MTEKITKKMNQKLTMNVKKQMSKNLMGYSQRYHGYDLSNRHPLYWLWWWTKFTQETQGDSDEEEGTTPRPSSTTNTAPTKPTRLPPFDFRLFGCKCGIANEKPSQGRIVHGENAERNEYPWIVLLKGRLTNCGGSIISRKTILTAAHCLVNEITLEGYSKQELKEGALSVYVGEHDKSIRDGEMIFSAVDTLVHPLYKGEEGDYEYDYGIVILAKDLDWSSKVRPICLPVQGIKYVNRKAYLAGWGKDYYGPFLNPNILQKTILLIKTIAHSECEECTPRMIGAVNKDSSACNGDSGGPLAVKDFAWPWGRSYYTVVGIASFLKSDCYRGDTNYFARVTEALDWITNNMQGTDCSKPGLLWNF